MFSTLKLVGPSQSQYGFPPLGSFIDAKPVLPVTDQLTGLYFLRNSPDRLKNYADVTKPLTLVGAPNAAATFSVANLANHYDTGLMAPETWTAIVVSSLSNNSTTDGGMDLSNYGADVAGDSLGSNSTGANISIYANVTNGTTPTVKSANVAYPGGSQFQVYAGVFSSAPAIKKIDAASGAITTALTDMTGVTRAAPAARTLRIGGHYRAGVFTGNRRISLVAIYARALSDAEIKSVGDYLRLTWCPAVGIVLS